MAAPCRAGSIYVLNSHRARILKRAKRSATRANSSMKRNVVHYACCRSTAHWRSRSRNGWMSMLEPFMSRAGAGQYIYPIRRKAVMSMAASVDEFEAILV